MKKGDRRKKNVTRSEVENLIGLYQKGNEGWTLVSRSHSNMIELDSEYIQCLVATDKFIRFVEDGETWENEKYVLIKEIGGLGKDQLREEDQSIDRKR